MLRRVDVIRQRWEAPSTGYLWGHVPKPKGMRRATYERLVAELRACHVGALADFTARTDRLFASIDLRPAERR